jgi:hypothetical protein
MIGRHYAGVVPLDISREVNVHRPALVPTEHKIAGEILVPGIFFNDLIVVNCGQYSIPCNESPLETHVYMIRPEDFSLLYAAPDEA